MFLSSFCVMVIELVAGRIISRHLGSSLYTWTSVIGVILAGLALGNAVGGLLADRYPARPALGSLFLLSALTCVLVTAANNVVGDWTPLWRLAWPARVALHVALVFFLPSAILGTIGPIAARLALEAGRPPGRTLGGVYAWGVLGSLVGTFSTGYFLIATLGTQAILWGVAGVLAAAALATSPRLPRAWAGGSAVAVACLLAHAPWAWARPLGNALALRRDADPSVLYTDESAYSHIEVRRLQAQPEVRGLYLDRLLHTELSLDRPFEAQYGYVQVFAELTHRLSAGKTPLRTLTIGGGGYAFPRFLESVWPGSHVEVVEIDPAVTRAARAAFGLPANSTIEIHHEDGRAFVNRLTAERRAGRSIAPYDFIYLDAVNDYSVPFQLTAEEFHEQVRGLLAPDGVELVNFIDVPQSGLLIGALATTLERVYPHIAVYGTPDSVHARENSRLTFVLAASRAPLERGAAPAGTRSAPRLEPATLEAYERKAGGIVLTDSFAPVENLLAPVVRASALGVASGEALQRGLARFAAGDLEGFVAGCRQALEFEPDLAEAHYNLGIGLHRLGREAEAIDRFRRALELRPDYGEAHFNLGAAYLEQHRLEEAIAHLRRSVELQPEFAAGYNGLGIALAAAGQEQAALAQFDQAMRLAPNDPQPKQNLARTLARLALRRSGT